MFRRRARDGDLSAPPTILELRQLRDERDCGCSPDPARIDRKVKRLEKIVYDYHGPVQNEVVSQRMMEFFWSLTAKHRADPESVALIYGRVLWHHAERSLVGAENLSRSRHWVGLSTGNSKESLERLTKRTVLIADTLLLSHDWSGGFHQLGPQSVKATNWTGRELGRVARLQHRAWTHRLAINQIQHEWATKLNNKAENYGLHCPNLTDLGTWLLDAENLLKSGLAWYLPSYSISTQHTVNGASQEPVNEPQQVKAIDYLIKDGRAVDASGAEPIKSQLIRPVLSIDLPFIEGVSLQDFSKITTDEYDSFSAFRDFLRERFLDMDEAMNAVQSQRELDKLSLQIKNQARSARSELGKVRRKKSVATAGAVLGSTSATLVAVYGPALQAALAVLGATGGVWGLIHAATENSSRALREDKWYYVWALAQKNPTRVL